MKLRASQLLEVVEHFDDRFAWMMS